MMTTNYRSPVLCEPRIFGGQHTITTPAGHVTSNQPPPLPPRLFQPINGTVIGNGYGNRFGMSTHGYSGPINGYGIYGNNIMNNSMYGSGYGYSYPYPENRFIQMAEESSRSTFRSIEALVGAINNIASMLDSTYFALTSSFRSVLGLAANFAHIRGVFAQFWTSLAIYRWIVWCYKKILFLLKLTKTDTTINSFNEAFKIAENGRNTSERKESSLPVVLFLGFIMAAPYLLMKLFASYDQAEQRIKPSTWQKPLKAVAMFNFEATNSEELTIRAGQHVVIAPKSIQIEQNLLNTGWVLASTDNTTSGLIPVSYIQGSQYKEDTEGKTVNSKQVENVS
ncbi:peroxisomal membrane protein PEX13 [Malaya genurostris]|uniref:peroxisomal membrane protein PEX13 n=1 Tax=Malaya genurostris TaxID=325434 RepID=UPI0026F3E157|nr:peroxisomal membrane protein PEX13 [Malaya genurostris]